MVTAMQQADPGSLYHFLRSLIRLRRENPALGSAGRYRCLNPEGVDFPLVIERSTHEQTCLVVVNPWGREEEVELPECLMEARYLLNQGCDLVQASGSSGIRVAEFGYAIVELDRN